MSTTIETAVVGGGCFWCLEAAFKLLRGVESVESGYAAGAVPQPSYEAVCAGTTGHAEVVRITFDPAQISFAELLQVFFTLHDPTTLNRQGNDVGTQYRSIIIAQDAQQAQEARDFLRWLEAEAVFPQPVVTELTTAAVAPFYPAESYHQNYYANHPEQAYCAYVIAPKLAKTRAYFQTK